MSDGNVLRSKGSQRTNKNVVFVYVCSWTEVIKSAVDDLKKSGAPMRLSLPLGGAGAPFSPSTYVFMCVFMFVFWYLLCTEY